MKNIRTNNGHKAMVRDVCHKKIQSLRRKYACVGYAIYWREGERNEVEFQGWGRTVYTCKGERV
jgi:hypothetical protein